MKKYILMVVLMLCSIDSAFCFNASEDSLNFHPFRRVLRDISSGARGMLDSCCLNKLANSQQLNLDELMITRVGLNNALENLAKKKIEGAEEIKSHLEIIQRTAQTPSDEELHSSLRVLHDWLSRR